MSAHKKHEPPMVAGRLPPNDLDAEAAVLSAVLLSRDALDRVLETLKPEHFYSDANGRIYEAAVTLSLAGTPVDITTVGGYLRDRETLAAVGGPSYLAQLADATPAVAHVVAHAKIIHEKWRLRSVIATCQRVAAEGYGDVGDPQAFIDGAEQAIYSLSHSAHKRDMVSMRTAIINEFTALNEAAERGEQMIGCPTGFPRLDERIAGLAPGDLTIIAGRPGMGKTAFATAVGINIAAPRSAMVQDPNGGDELVRVDNAIGFGVCMFSLEMQLPQMTSRALCTEARVDLGKYRKRRLQQEDWNSLTESAGFLSAIPFWIDDTPAINILELRAKVRRRQAEFNRPAAPGVPERKVSLVIIDYLQLMGSAQRMQNREQEIAALSRGLKEMGKELGVAVVALAQLNRAAETRSSKDKRPQLSDLRESGSLEQDADNVLFVYRHEYYFPDEEKYKGVAEIIAAKVRNGPPGKTFVRFDGKYARFDNLDPADWPEMEDE